VCKCENGLQTLREKDRNLRPQRLAVFWQNIPRYCSSKANMWSSQRPLGLVRPDVRGGLSRGTLAATAQMRWGLLLADSGTSPPAGLIQLGSHERTRINTNRNWGVPCCAAGKQPEPFDASSFGCRSGLPFTSLVFIRGFPTASLRLSRPCTSGYGVDRGWTDAQNGSDHPRLRIRSPTGGARAGVRICEHRCLYPCESVFIRGLHRGETAVAWPA